MARRPYTRRMAEGVDPRFEAEMRRGVVQLVALHLCAEPRYGYDLVRLLSAAGFPVEEGTLYPILRRLEKQGLLTAEWQTDGKRPRKYYVLSEEGRQARDAMAQAWRTVRGHTDAALDSLAQDVGPEQDAPPTASSEAPPRETAATEEDSR